MSKMIDRAAKAIWETWSERVRWDERREFHKDETRKEARAALSAALDPEDEALVEIIARSISLCGRDWDAPFDFDAAPDYAKDMQRDIARAAISALKAAAMGEQKP